MPLPRVLYPLPYLQRYALLGLFLIERLRGRFTFIVATHDPQIEAACAERGLACLRIPELPAPRPSRWLKAAMRLPLIGRWVREGFADYVQQKVWGAQARALLAASRADLVLTDGDYDGLGFHLCQHAPASVIEVSTVAWLDMDDSLAWFRRVGGRKQAVLRAFFRLLWRITGKPPLQYARQQVILPHGAELWRTLGAWLGGLRYAIPLKGGTNASAVCLMGEHYRTPYLEAGIPAHKLHVTGSALHDWTLETVACFDAPAQAAFRAELDLPPTARLITFFLQPYDTWLDKALFPADTLALVEILRGLDAEVWVVVKAHPIQTRDRLQGLAETLENMERVRFIPAESAQGDVFNARLTFLSALVVTLSSTTGFVAWALDVPLVTYSFHGQGSLYRLTGGTRHAPTLGEFSAHVRTLWQDETARHALLAEARAVRAQQMKLDGRNCQRIGDVLASLVTPQI